MRRMIDPTARVAPGAVIGETCQIGPYCMIGPNVALGDGCRLVVAGHIAGHTTIGARTSIYPFASLGTPPQSVQISRRADPAVIGADCDIRETSPMNIGTEDGGGVTHSRRRLLPHGRLPCRRTTARSATTSSSPTTWCSAGMSRSATMSCSAAQAAVHQFVRIGEGAMIVGLSGARADVIPCGDCAARPARPIWWAST